MHIRRLSKYTPRESTKLPEKISEDEKKEEKKGPVKRKRGRPRKNPEINAEKLDKPKRGRGRPRKNIASLLAQLKNLEKQILESQESEEESEYPPSTESD